MKSIYLALLLTLLVPTVGFSQLYEKKITTFQGDEKQDEPVRSYVSRFRASGTEGDESTNGSKIGLLEEKSPEAPVGDSLLVLCLLAGMYAVFIAGRNYKSELGLKTQHCNVILLKK